jgi:hypothetical protein
MKYVGTLQHGTDTIGGEAEERITTSLLPNERLTIGRSSR